MFTLQQILHSQSPLLKGKKVKLVRHKDNRPEYREAIKDKEGLLKYQNTQPKDVFGQCDYIISFIGLEQSRALFFAVFKKNGCEIKNEEYDYDFERVAEFDLFEDRLVIDWGKSTISWNQWYNKQEKEMIEILPQGYIGNFPGLLDFVLEYDELKKLINNPNSNIEWKNHLSSVNGIYLILDSSSGQQYIGSANGKNGIWQRWQDYAQNGHGNNKKLISLHLNAPLHSKNFRFSVLQTLPSNITKPEIDKIESLYKQKLGSRTYGLNDN